MEDDLHILAQRLHFIAVVAGDVFAVESDLPLRVNEAQQAEAERGLARSGFADDADGVALFRGEGNVVDGFYPFGGFAEEVFL